MLYLFKFRNTVTPINLLQFKLRNAFLIKSYSLAIKIKIIIEDAHLIIRIIGTLIFILFIIIILLTLITLHIVFIMMLLLLLLIHWICLFVINWYLIHHIYERCHILIIINIKLIISTHHHLITASPWTYWSILWHLSNLWHHNKWCLMIL